MSIFEESGLIKRCSQNPVLAAADAPYESSLVFNAGITKFNGKYVMVFRNDFGFYKGMYDNGNTTETGTNIGLAFSDNGIDWQVQPEPCFSMQGKDISRAYDPRLTVIDGRCYMCFAIDTRQGVRGGIAVTDDFKNFEVLSITAPDNRNMVLFPEKIGGNYIRLERPFPVYSHGGKENFDVWLGRSPDMRYWGDFECILNWDEVPFCNSKLGPAAPPVKTEKGWLTTFHAVWKQEEASLFGWEASWGKIYYGGLMLLDLEDPSKVLGVSKKPLISPVEKYEEEGFRGSVIFPGGMILEDDGEVKIYYGAADTVECLATASVDDLVKSCLE